MLKTIIHTSTVYRNYTTHTHSQASHFHGFSMFLTQNRTPLPSKASSNSVPRRESATPRQRLRTTLPPDPNAINEALQCWTHERKTYTLRQQKECNAGSGSGTLPSFHGRIAWHMVSLQDPVL